MNIQFGKEIEHYTTQTFSGSMAAGDNEFQSDVYVSFQPDAIILKHFTFSNASDPATYEVDIGLTTSTMTNPPTMCTFLPIGVGLQTVDVLFKNSRAINGTHTFGIKSSTGHSWSRRNYCSGFHIHLY
jgi:hypothetical protein